MPQRKKPSGRPAKAPPTKAALRKENSAALNAAHQHKLVDFLMAELELGITLAAIGTFTPAGAAIDAVRDLKHRIEDSKARRKVERSLVKLEHMISGRSGGKGRKRKRGRGADRDVGRTLRIDD